MRVPEYPVGGTIDQAGIPSARVNSIASPESFSVGSRQLEALGRAGEALTNNLWAEQQRTQAAQAVDITKSAVMKAGADGTLYWTQRTTEDWNSRKMEDPDYFKKHSEEFDKWSSEQVNAMSSPEAKAMMQEKMLSLKVHFGTQVINYQEAAARNKVKDNFKSSVDGMSQLVMSDPKQYGPVLEQLKQGLPDTDPITSSALHDYAQSALRDAAAMGAVQQNPEMFIHTATEALDAHGGNEWEIVKGIESGGRQFGADGEVLKSPMTRHGQSMGISQMLPSTGPEAAKLAGVEWDENKFRNDPAYNEQLGQAYYGSLRKKYGNPIQAMAAYNTGPGNVDKLVEKYGDQWSQHLPDETKAYIKKAATKLDDTGTLENVDGFHALRVNTGVPFVDGMSAKDLMHYQNMAQAELNRRQQAAKIQLEQTAKDQVAQALYGKPPVSPLTPDHFRAAYGDGWETQYKNYSSGLQFGADYQALGPLPPAQRQALLERNAPVENSPGYAAQVERYNSLQKASDGLQKAAQDDPIGYAAQFGIANVSKLDYSNASKFAQTMAQRSMVADFMAENYGAPKTLFGKGEADQTLKWLSSQPVDERVKILGQIAAQSYNKQNVLDTWDKLKVSSTDADAAYLATKGMIIQEKQSSLFSNDVVTTYNVPKMIMEGAQLAKDGNKPKDGIAAAIRAKVSGLYGGNIEEESSVANRAISIYTKEAYDSQRLGDDPASAGEAIDHAIKLAGGHFDADKKMIYPWGMSPAGFDDALPGAVSQAVQALGVAGMDEAQAHSVLNDKDVKWQAIKDGYYRPIVGNSTILSRNGAPFVIKVAP